MDFELSDEQAAFRELIRDFARREIKPVAREWEHSGRYPTEIVEQMRELGLFGLLVPQEYGGADVDAVSYAIVFEELARVWMGISGIIGTRWRRCCCRAMGRRSRSAAGSRISPAGHGARVSR
jgi:alkylation response protein AidB-like acyl-CoA dehydrogenase